tara:strand:- start:1357 stop:2481 length:1125 start_codon:yes stop_codon:yes gene_type:complete
MQLTDTYSASCGLKIEKPYVYDLFFPFIEEKIITIDTDTNNYKYWDDVISLIHPYLVEKNISIFQLGNKESALLRNVSRTNGMTNASQKSFIIKKSELHIGGNTYSTQLASFLGKNLICLVDEKDKALPFTWGNSEKHHFIYPESKDFIEPEKLAQIILEKLKINFKFKYETLFIGNKYFDGIQYIEMYPSSPVILRNFNINSILVRMDLNFSEEVLAQQLRLGKASILTSQKINMNILRSFRDNIVEIFYDIKEENDLEFCEQVKSLGIECKLISFMSEDKIDSCKLKYMEMGNITPQKVYSFSDLPNYKDLNVNDLFFKSKKVIIKDGDSYLSPQSAEKGIKSIASSDIQKVVDTEDFWKNLDAFLILKKIS